jgi:hypothetical protein
MAAIGVLLIASTVHRQANLWTLESFATAYLWFAVGCQISESYVIIGLITAVYSCYTIRGFSPHVFPSVLRPTIMAILHLFVMFCKCWFHVRHLSRVKPTYLTSPAVFRRILKKVGGRKPSRFLLFMKGISAVLLGFTCSFPFSTTLPLYQEPFAWATIQCWCASPGLVWQCHQRTPGCKSLGCSLSLTGRQQPNPTRVGITPHPVGILWPQTPEEFH